MGVNGSARGMNGGVKMLGILGMLGCLTPVLVPDYPP